MKSHPVDSEGKSIICTFSKQTLQIQQSIEKRTKDISSVPYTTLTPLTVIIKAMELALSNLQTQPHLTFRSLLSTNQPTDTRQQPP